MADNPNPPQPSPQPSQKALELDQCDFLYDLRELFRSRLRNYVRSCVSDGDAVQDIVQDTWLRVARSDLFQERSAPYYEGGCLVDLTVSHHCEEIWSKIKGQAYFARLSHFKQAKIELDGELQKVKHVSFDSWHENGGDPAAEVSPGEVEMLAIAIDRLKAHGFRQLEIDVFTLYTLNGWKYREIAERLGISKSTVDRIIHKIEAFAEDNKDGFDD